VLSLPHYLQTITLPTPFSVGPINCYLAVGDVTTLIDTGPKDPTTLAVLRDELSARGLGIRDIRRIVITHAHVDHLGLAAQITAESGACVWAHSRNLWWLTDYEREWERRFEFYREAFHSCGVPKGNAEQVILEMRRMTRYADPIPADKFVSVEDGEALDLGSDAWQVVFAPGHASGLICLYEPKSRILISSDHLLRDITSNPIFEPPAPDEKMRPFSLADYIASMKRTAEMNVRLALTSHGAPIYDVGALVAARLAFHRSRLDHIEQQLGCRATTAYELCGILFPKLKTFDIFLGLSEAIGHLDILEMEGRVRRENRNGTERYVTIKK